MPCLAVDLAHRPDMVAQQRGALEIHRLGGFVHLARQQVLHVAAFAGEESPSLARPAPRRPFHRCARCKAPLQQLDLMQRGRGACVPSNTASGQGAQQKGPLQRVQRRVDRTRRGEGAVIAPTLRLGAAMFQDLRERVIRPHEDAPESSCRRSNT